MASVEFHEDDSLGVYEQLGIPVIVINDCGAIISATTLAANVFGYDTTQDLVVIGAKTLWEQPNEVARWVLPSSISTNAAGMFRAKDAGGQCRLVTLMRIPSSRCDASVFLVAATASAETGHVDGIQNVRMDAVSSLSGAVGHSLNNLLSGFVGYLMLLRSALPSGDIPESVPRYLDALDTTVARFRDLTRTLMTVAGRTEADPPSAVDVGAAITSVLAERDDGITVSCEIPSTGATVIADSDMLAKIFARCIDGGMAVLPKVTAISLTVEPYANSLTVEDCENRDVGGPHTNIQCVFEHQPTTNIAFERFFEPYYTARDVGHGAEFMLSEAWVLTHALNGHITACAESPNCTRISLCLPNAS